MILYYHERCAPVAQLDRASGFEPEGREFKSLRARHFLLVFHLVTSFYFLRGFFRGALSRNVTLRAPGRLCRWPAACAREPGEPTPTDKRVSSPGYCGAWRVAQLRREQPNSVACRTHAGVNCRSGNTKHRLS